MNELSELLAGVKNNTLTSLNLAAGQKHTQITPEVIKDHSTPKFRSLLNPSEYGALKACFTLADNNILFYFERGDILIWDVNNRKVLKNFPYDDKQVNHKRDCSQSNEMLLVWVSYSKVRQGNYPNEYYEWQHDLKFFNNLGGNIKSVTFNFFRNNQWGHSNFLAIPLKTGGFVTACSHYTYNPTIGNYQLQFFNAQGDCINTVTGNQLATYVNVTSLTALDNGNCLVLRADSSDGGQKIPNELKLFSDNGNLIKMIASGKNLSIVSAFDNGYFIFRNDKSFQLVDEKGNIVKTLADNIYEVGVAPVGNKNFIFRNSQGISLYNLAGEVVKSYDISYHLSDNQYVKTNNYLCAVISDPHNSNHQSLMVIEHNSFEHKILFLGEGKVTDLLYLFNQYIAVCLDDKKTLVFDVEKGDCLQTYHHGGKLGFLSDKRLVIANRTSLICDLVETRSLSLKDLRPFFLVLQNNTSVTKLDLQGLKLKDKGARKLAKMLSVNQHITELNLENTQITDTGAMELLIALDKNRSLKKLHRGKNNISENVLRQIETKLQQNAENSSVQISSTERSENERSFRPLQQSIYQSKPQSPFIEKQVKIGGEAIVDMITLPENRLVSATAIGKISLWDMGKKQLLWEVQDNPLQSMVLLPENKLLASNGNVYDLTSGHKILQSKVTFDVRGTVAIFPDGKIATCNDQAIYFWDRIDSEQYEQTVGANIIFPNSNTNYSINLLRIFPINQALKIIIYTKVKQIKLGSGNLQNRLPPGGILAKNIDFNGKITSHDIISTGNGIDILYGECIFLNDTDHLLFSMASGSRINYQAKMGAPIQIPSQIDTSLHIFSKEQQKSIQLSAAFSRSNTLPKHIYAFTALSFFAKDQLIAAAAKDGLIRIWDMKQENRLIAQFSTDGDEINSLAFLDDGRLIGGGANGRLHIWHLDRRPMQVMLPLPQENTLQELTPPKTDESLQKSSTVVTSNEKIAISEPSSPQHLPETNLTQQLLQKVAQLEKQLQQEKQQREKFTQNLKNPQEQQKSLLEKQQVLPQFIPAKYPDQLMAQNNSASLLDLLDQYELDVYGLSLVHVLDACSSRQEKLQQKGALLTLAELEQQLEQQLGVTPYTLRQRRSLKRLRAGIEQLLSAWKYQQLENKTAEGELDRRALAILLEQYQQNKLPKVVLERIAQLAQDEKSKIYEEWKSSSEQNPLTKTTLLNKFSNWLITEAISDYPNLQEKLAQLEKQIAFEFCYKVPEFGKELSDKRGLIALFFISRHQEFEEKIVKLFQQRQITCNSLHQKIMQIYRQLFNEAVDIIDTAPLIQQAVKQVLRDPQQLTLDEQAYLQQVFADLLKNFEAPEDLAKVIKHYAIEQLLKDFREGKCNIAPALQQELSTLLSSLLKAGETSENEVRQALKALLQAWKQGQFDQELTAILLFPWQQQQRQIHRLLYAPRVKGFGSINEINQTNQTEQMRQIHYNLLPPPPKKQGRENALPTHQTIAVSQPQPKLPTQSQLSNLNHSQITPLSFKKNDQENLQKPVLSNPTYWYQSDVLQDILTARCNQVEELRLAKNKRFLRAGKNEAGTFFCDRYPNQQFYVAIGDATDVGNEQAKFQDNKGNINQDVSYGIDFLSLMGAPKDNVVYTVSETLLTHKNFANWNVNLCQQMFFTECRTTHGLQENEIERMDLYKKELGSCQSIEEARQVLTEAWRAHRVPTVFSEVLLLITATQATTCQARIILPLNIENRHWISLEIALFFNPETKQLKAEIWQHDPYGGNGNLNLAENEKFQQQLKLVLAEEMKTLSVELNKNQPLEIIFKQSPYQTRQQDGSSCGAITIEDIVLLAQGETLNGRLQEKGAPNLRQQHQLVYHPSQKNDTQPQKPKTDKEKSENETESSEQFSSLYPKNTQKPSNPSDKKKFQTSLEAVDYFSNEVKQQKNFKEKDLEALMKDVMEGNLDGVAERLNKQPELMRCQMKWVDYAGRIFPRITPFQLAVWYGDWPMWNRMRDKNLGSQLSNKQAALQYHALKYHDSAVSGDNGSGFSFEELLPAYKELEQLIQQQKWIDCDECFVEKVGGAQRKVPAWYQQLMAFEGENSDWCYQKLNEFSPRSSYSSFSLDSDRGFTSKYIGRLRGKEDRLKCYNPTHQKNLFKFKHILSKHVKFPEHLNKDSEIDFVPIDFANSINCSQLSQTQRQNLELSLPLKALSEREKLPATSLNFSNELSVKN